MMSGVNEMADTLGQQFAQVEGQEGLDRIKVVVSDIQSLEQYARTAKYLASLDIVDSVQATEVGQNQVAFLLLLRGQIQSFKQATVYGETLAADDSQPAQQADASPPPAPDSLSPDSLSLPADDSSQPATTTDMITLHYRLLP